MKRALLGVLGCVMAACGTAEVADAPSAAAVAPGTGAGLPEVVPLGKEDNYLSPQAQEYTIEGTSEITLDEADAALSEDEQLAKVKRLIPYRQVVIGWFLNAWVGSKSHDATNKEYGDFHALTKNGSYEEMNIEKVGPLTWRFTLTQEIGGPVDLLSRMPVETAADGTRTFALSVGVISNDEMQQLETDHEWYRKAPWSAFDPAKATPEQVQTQVLTIRPQPRSLDAWPDYARLFADGKVTIGVHFGWDYHSEYHLKHSRSVYDWLVARGFHSPVAGYDDYTRTSGPLTRTIQAAGKPVDVEVSLFWGKPGTDTDPDTAAGGRQLEDDMKESLRAREVVVFSGHSGPFYGFALANWRKTSEGDLDDSEIPLLDMPADTYQVVLAEGCETYALGQAFWDNPSKADQTTLDVLTTTSFSNASTSSTVTDFLRAMVGTSGSGDVHAPMTYGDLLEDLDSNSYWFATMYGVHGIDDNPHLHPWADPKAFCRTCSQSADCGAQGNICVGLGGHGICAAPCTSDDGCPDGFACAAVASGTSITGRACVPTNLSCEQPSTDGPAVLVNEVLADPPPGLAGDANGDGTRDAVEDEFIELFNTTTLPIDLGGWTLSDAVRVRYTFPQGLRIQPGALLVVFGSDTQSGLGLSNSGDTVVLRSEDGRVVDQVTFGAEGGKDRSLVREHLGDPKSPLVPHPDSAPFSPGT